MQAFSEWMSNTLGMGPVMQSNIILSLVAFAILLITRWIALRLVEQYAQKPEARYRARKVVGYVITLIGVLIIGRIWFQGIDDVATILGLLGAGLVVVYREPLANLGAWLFIVTRRPFEVGDRIQVGDAHGDVVDIRLFEFTVLEIGNWVDADQSTGRVIHVPNLRVFSESLANYHKGVGYIWDEISVLVTFESDWQHARQLMTEIAMRETQDYSEMARENQVKASSRYLISYSKLSPIVYTAVREYGVKLTLRYLCPPRSRRSSENALWEAILVAFAAAEDVEFAYPTQRFFNHPVEGIPVTTRSQGPGTPRE